MVNDQTQPFPAAKWHGFQMRMTKAARDCTKRWKQNKSGYRVDGNAELKVSITVYMKGDGELVGWESPSILGFEPRSRNWVEALGLDKEG